jgi:hypothetical protein
MKKYIYNWDIVNHTDAVHQERLLKVMGEDGWELVSAVVLKFGYNESLVFYWKKEIKDKQ